MWNEDADYGTVQDFARSVKGTELASWVVVSMTDFAVKLMTKRISSGYCKQLKATELSCLTKVHMNLE